MENSIINTTSLAKAYHMTTKDAVKYLEKAGISPLAEVQMASGRTFKTWDRAQAVEVLEAVRNRRQSASTQATEVSDETPKADETCQKVEALEKELHDVKNLLSQILEVLTKP